MTLFFISTHSDPLSLLLRSLKNLLISLGSSYDALYKRIPDATFTDWLKNECNTIDKRTAKLSEHNKKPEVAKRNAHLAIFENSI